MKSVGLFGKEQITSKIHLEYSATSSVMPAQELGAAIIGMSQCLRIAGRTALLDFEDVYIYPIEEGSVKTTFVYIKKHPWHVLVGLELVTSLLNNSVNLIGRFGANSFRQPTQEILAEIPNEKILRLCQNIEFRRNLQKVAEPLGEFNVEAKIISSNDFVQLTLPNKYQFFVGNEVEKILPELVNGSTVTLLGEITRINKTTNDLGFKYKDHILSVVPIDKEISTAEYHQYLTLDQVKLTGTITRDNDFVTPGIQVSTIEPIIKEQQKLFGK